LKFETCLENKKFFNETDIQRIMRDCIIGLDVLHRNNIVHRDIKPQNIMLDEHGKAKFADFGISCILDELENGDNFRDSAGTTPYMAPEICNPEIVSYSGKVADIWALGITCFGFTFNSMPYWGENEMKIFESIRNDPLVMPDDRKDVSPGLINIIKGMLEKDPSKRLTLD
jgi:serine/threonine protein kinase